MGLSGGDLGTADWLVSTIIPPKPNFSIARVISPEFRSTGIDVKQAATWIDFLPEWVVERTIYNIGDVRDSCDQGDPVGLEPS
jgi:hypothetical protein